ncbi:MAG: hypothetical protein VB957_01790 [Pseudomonadales bacterium]|jgi:hypothetical protein
MDNKVICHYRVTKGNEAEFEILLTKHWPVLHKLGLVTDDPSVQYKGEEQDNGQPIYYETFDWLDGAVDRAHEHPEVMAIWESMDKLCETRGDKLNMEFPHVVPINE